VLSEFENGGNDKTRKSKSPKLLGANNGDRRGVQIMKAMRLEIVIWLFMFSNFLLFGCSYTPTSISGNKPAPSSAPIKIDQPPLSQPEQIVPSPVSQPEQIVPPPEAKVKYFIHIIKYKGEDLTLIARWYTGSGKNWLRIVEVNPSIDHRRIQIGDSILIPESLLKTRQPMPISYVHRKVSKKKKQPVPSDNSISNIKEVELFGPVDTDTQAGNININDSLPPLETID
jgi:hypothetical protein